MHSDGLGATTPTTGSFVDGDDNDELSQPSPRSTDGFDMPITAQSSFAGAFAFDASVLLPPPPLPPQYFAACSITQVHTDMAAFPASRPAVTVFSTCPAVLQSEGVGNRRRAETCTIDDRESLIRRAEGVGNQCDVMRGIHRNYQGLDASSGLESQTSLMVRNLSPDLTQPEFVQHLINGGYRGLFDFVYMPMNLRACGSFGYTFVNFKSHSIAAQVMARLQSSQKGDVLSSLEWSAVWSTCQGLDANIDRYRNSPLMHDLVPKDAKPSVYDSNGILATFPAPTKTISRPRIHRPKADSC